MSDVSQQSWIRVEDRLPDEDDLVLMCHEHPESPEYRFVLPGVYLGDGYFKEWNTTLVVYEPTHWMPLPPPPPQEQTTDE